jgi:methylmalonyl-CoA mutase N-terminal domain/subunit
MQAYVAGLSEFKKSRSNGEVQKAIAALARSANDRNENVFAHVVSAAEAGATHGEICRTLRQELGFGQPLTVV